MDVVSSFKMGVAQISVPPLINMNSLHRPSFPVHNSTFPFLNIRRISSTVHAKKRSSKSDSVIEQSLVEEIFMDDDDEEEVLFEDFEDEGQMDDEDVDYFEEEEDVTELYVGDGGGGGGISLAGTWWDKEALAIAEDVCMSFDGDLKIYAFKTLSNSTIQVRIEKMSNKSGSPSMEDIEAFSTAYRVKLDAAEVSKSIPENTSLEVSSPGIERVVRIPLDLDRFKDRPMYVKYISEISGSSSESEGVFSLISFDMEAKQCMWGLANVKINREKAGKGRPLSKKQREWRLTTSFDSLRLVRLYPDF